jgi:hypothetical protein
MTTAVGILIVLAVVVGVASSRARRRRSNADGAASYMGKGRDLRALSATGANRTAQRLGIENWLGVPIGITVAGRQQLYGSPEDMHIDIWDREPEVNEPGNSGDSLGSGSGPHHIEQA